MRSLFAFDRSWFSKFTSEALFFLRSHAHGAKLSVCVCVCAKLFRGPMEPHKSDSIF